LANSLDFVRKKSKILLS